MVGSPLTHPEPSTPQQAESRLAICLLKLPCVLHTFPAHCRVNCASSCDSCSSTGMKGTQLSRYDIQILAHSCEHTDGVPSLHAAVLCSRRCPERSRRRR